MQQGRPKSQPGIPPCPISPSICFCCSARRLSLSWVVRSAPHSPRSFQARCCHAIMPVLLVTIAIFVAVKPNLNDLDTHRRKTPFTFGLTLVPVIGFYDGVFGPRTGSFFMLAFVTLAGLRHAEGDAPHQASQSRLEFRRADRLRKLRRDTLEDRPVMGACQFLGAQLGSRLASHAHRRKAHQAAAGDRLRRPCGKAARRPGKSAACLARRLTRPLDHLPLPLA